jgi:hypothetical protein
MERNCFIRILKLITCITNYINNIGMQILYVEQCNKKLQYSIRTVG